jgi:magnesium-transporting ATPase (P-type)
MFVIFIVLAALGFITMMVGLVLMKNRFKWTKLDGTYRYRMSDNSAGKNGTQIRQREIGIQKLKGIAGTFSISYQIPEFYQKLKSGDHQTIRFAFLFFGGVFFVFNTFLAIGTALVEGGNPNGWLFIGLVAFVIILTAWLHLRSVRQSNKTD